MNKEKTLKGFGAIVGVLTAGTLVYNYPLPTLASLALMGLGYYVGKKLDE